MLFEAEVVFVFINAVCIVSLLELLIGCWLLRRAKKIMVLFIGNVISMTIALFFLVLCVFGTRLDFVQEFISEANSAHIGLFGAFWAISVGFLLAILSSKTKKT